MDRKHLGCLFMFHAIRLHPSIDDADWSLYQKLVFRRMVTLRAGAIALPENRPPKSRTLRRLFRLPPSDLKAHVHLFALVNIRTQGRVDGKQRPYTSALEVDPAHDLRTVSG